MLSHRIKAYFCTKESLIASAIIFFLLISVLVSLGKHGNSNSSDIVVASVDDNGEGSLGSVDFNEIISDSNTEGNFKQPVSGEYEQPDDDYTPESEQPDDMLEPEPNDNGVTSKSIADELIGSLLKRIGSGQGPIIVGGIGDSGTRGVRDVIQRFGAQMLGEGFIHPLSKDSQIFMDSYATFDTKGKEIPKCPSGLYTKIIRTSHTLNYNESIVPFDHWHTGRQYVAKMVNRSMTVSQALSGRPIERLDPWGFKHPRTALLLPFWRAGLGDKFVFIHVMRDGKDIIKGDNQKVFNSGCGRYYGKHCDGSLQDRINLWTDLNRDIFQYALTSDMKAHQYMAIRIEDLVLGRETCYRRLAHFLGISPGELNKRIMNIIAANGGHKKSYFGRKWSPEIKFEIERAMRYNTKAQADLVFWGYGATNFTLSEDDCENLPWMKLMREKKGPLPGDQYAVRNHRMTWTPTIPSKKGR